MDQHQLSILTQLDTELPIIDPEVTRLTELLILLVDAQTLALLEQGYRDGVVRFGAHCLAASHGPVTEADIDFLFRAVHDAIPAGTDPAVISALDQRLTRLIEIGANIAAGDP